MKKTGIKLLILLIAFGGTATALFFVWASDAAMKSLPMAELSHEEQVEIEAMSASAHGHSSGGGHGEAPKADAHGSPSGGGHGEAPKADAHGAPAGGHGEAPKADAHGSPSGGGHGEAKADAHGGGHGGTARAPSSGSSGGLPLVSFDELFVNVMANQYSRSLAVKLELELFDEENRTLVDERQSAVKDTVLATAREQDYFRLSTISGKLYFKELLVGRINQYFKKPVVKDVHFSSFFLQ